MQRPLWMLMSLAAMACTITADPSGIDDDGGQFGDEGNPDGCFEIGTEAADAEAVFEGFGYTPSELAELWTSDWQGLYEGDDVSVSLTLDSSTAVRIVREWSDGSGDCDDALQLDATATVLIGDGLLDEELAVAMTFEDASTLRGGQNILADDLNGTMEPDSEFDGYDNTSLSIGVSFRESEEGTRSGQISLSWGASQDNGDGTGTGVAAAAQAVNLTPVE